MKLDGIWDFYFAKGKNINDFQIENSAYDEFAVVPGCFDVTIKHRFQRGLAVYRRMVCASGMQKLVIGAIGLRARVFWDKKELGICPVPFCTEEFKFDAGNDGEHELVIAIDNIIDNGVDSLWREYYDFYAYGGIYRSVTIEELKDVEITFCKITTKELESRTMDVAVELEGDFAGKKIAFSVDGKTVLEADAQKSSSVSFALPGAALWDTENPNLHTLEVKVADTVKTVSFGIRQITCKDGKMLLNGKVFKIFGLNRHDCHPQHGYAVPETIVLDDIQAIKAQGFNCIRGSHYPQSQIVLDICDKVGMLVWNESLGWQNKVESLNSPGFQKLFLRQTDALVKNSVNHPCIIMWGFLNETFSDDPRAYPFMKVLAERVRSIDTSRPLTYASNRTVDDLCMDLTDIMSFNTYPAWYAIPGSDPNQQEFDPWAVEKSFSIIKEFASQECFNKRPVLISEIGAEALPGDHSGLRWSEDYQADLIDCVLDLIQKDDILQGVFLWMYCDSKTYSNPTGQARARGYNNKGLVDEYRRPKLSWKVAGKRLKQGK